MKNNMQEQCKAAFALIFWFVALLTTSRSIISSMHNSARNQFSFWCYIVLFCALTNVLKLNACRIVAYSEAEGIFSGVVLLFIVI
jgi:hypothetical protein